MRAFFTIWAGQFISVLGSGLTSFALGVWIYGQTGQATPFALTALFYTLPGLILMPVAGSFADRYNCRWIMILADSGAALVTAITFLLLLLGDLQIWHIYLLAFFGSLFRPSRNRPTAPRSPCWCPSSTWPVPAASPRWDRPSAPS